MRKSLVAAAAGLTFVLVAGTRPAQAFEETVTAHVPFAFHVGEQSLPAGDYVIKPLDHLEPNLLEIRTRQRTGAVAIFWTTPEEPRAATDRAEMLFDDVGKQKFLREIRVPDDAGAWLNISHPEVQAARESASSASPQQRSNGH